MTYLEIRKLIRQASASPEDLLFTVQLLENSGVLDHLEPSQVYHIASQVKHHFGEFRKKYFRHDGTFKWLPLFPGIRWLEIDADYHHSTARKRLAMIIERVSAKNL